ncbi:MAG: alpha-L-fucosidase [bacterium]|nr:alpha-L-fucosidase [bacterium]
MRPFFSFFLLFSFCFSMGFAQERDATWFREAKFGVFVHYLGGGPEWNAQVERFDVKTFTDQIVQTKAGYVMFTLGQNSGYYCSPNATYEKLAGYEPGQRCAPRDLPMEIADALAKHDIRLILYLPSRSPQQDAQAMKTLGDVNEQLPAPQGFTKNWSAVIQEWSLRYGNKVAGWWFDGAYNTEGWDDYSQPANWRTWAAACRVGNPQSLLAFNRGANRDVAFIKQCEEQDYTAGEQNTFEATPLTNPAPTPLQWQLLAHLGTMWARADGPQQNDGYMIDYIRRVNELGGVVTLDVNVSPQGTIHEAHWKQLQAIGAALRP